MMMLVKHDSAPCWALYPNVLDGYRIYRTSRSGWLREALGTVCRWHTETVNIWTMVFTGTACLVLSIACFPIMPDIYTWLVLAAFSLTVALHCAMSACFHTVLFVSPVAYRAGRRLDMVGIFAGSVMLTLTLGWFVLPTWLLVLNTIATTTVATCGLRFMWNAVTDVEIVHVKTQAAWVASVTACWTFPMVYYCVNTQACLAAISSLSGLVTGGFVYAHGIPERWWPGKFDILGSSHQLMHLGIMVTHIMAFFFLLFTALQ